MFFLYRLILAHLLTDFPFQTSYIFKLRKNWWGNLIHASIFIPTGAILVLPFLGKAWLCVVFIGITHFIIDQWKVIKTKDGNIWLFLVDQIIHFSFIIIVATFLETKIVMVVPTLSLPPFAFSLSYLKGLIVYAYFQDKFILYLIGYLVSTFTGAVLIYEIERVFFPKIRKETVLDKGIISLGERALITTLIVINQYLWIPLVLLTKSIILFATQRKVDRFYQFLTLSLVLSASISILVGLCLRIID